MLGLKKNNENLEYEIAAVFESLLGRKCMSGLTTVGHS